MKNFPSKLWVVDFEYSTNERFLPRPICMVAREVRSGRLVKYWLADEELPQCPIDFGEGLYVAFAATAELGCHLALNWDFPEAIVDLYVEEYSLRTLRDMSGRSLADVLSSHGLSTYIPEEKGRLREKCISGGPFTPEDRDEILAYCQRDVDATVALLQSLWETIDLDAALMRGEYLKAVAKIERVGIPVDVENLESLRRDGAGFRQQLIKEVDRNYGVYRGTVFDLGLFESFLDRKGIIWPRLPSGRLELTQDVFKTMSGVHPELKDLHELRKTLSSTKQIDLMVGKDGRCRFSVMPFASKTSRNQPRAREFPFLRPKWFRFLMKPELGRALAYVDWSGQEFGIAAGLSRDPVMRRAYESGDPHIFLASMCGEVPDGANRDSHPRERDRFKVANLGILMGMGEKGLSLQLGSRQDARRFLRLHKEAFPIFWSWMESIQNHYFMGAALETGFGWPLNFHSKTSAPRVRNFLLQAGGAEMMRLAAIVATGKGLSVCCPVHDAFMIESSTERIEEDAQVLRQAMSEASRKILDGFALRTTSEIFVYPERFHDLEGAPMWRNVQSLMAKEAV